MSDLIERQAAIDAIENIDWYHQNDNGDMVSGASNEHEAWYMAEDIYRALESVPSAQPEQRWIPCNWHRDNENLPEECKKVLICIVDGNKICVDVSYRADYNRWERYGRVDVTAWMPLPEPYKEGEHDG